MTTTYVYDEESRLLSHTTSSVTTDYTYDDNGSVLTRTVGDIEETFSYDYLDRTASYVKTDTSGPTTLEEWAYAHMPTGQRVYSQDLDADETAWYMHDGHDVVTDYHQEGTGKLDLTVSYINALGLDDRIGRVTASGGATHFYVGDLVGTTAHLLTSSETLVNSEVRDAWGNSVASSLSVSDRYDFAGRESNSESGLTYMRHRLYDPRTGRFGQKDPIRGNRARKAYLYAGNSPIGTIDPLGLDELVLRGKDAYWRSETPGVWDSTVREVYIGSISYGQIHLSHEYGGGSIDVGHAKRIIGNHSYTGYGTEPSLKLSIQNAFGGGPVVAKGPSSTGAIVGAAGKGLAVGAASLVPGVGIGEGISGYGVDGERLSAGERCLAVAAELPWFKWLKGARALKHVRKVRSLRGVRSTTPELPKWKNTGGSDAWPANPSPHGPKGPWNPSADSPDGLGGPHGGPGGNSTPAEGIYEFPDMTGGGTPYVGQSGNIPQRLKQHETAGRYVPGTAETSEVLGGKEAREIAEHRRIQELTGGVPAAQSGRVTNKVDPIGSRRRHLLEE